MMVAATAAGATAVALFLTAVTTISTKTSMSMSAAAVSAFQPQNSSQIQPTATKLFLRKKNRENDATKTDAFNNNKSSTFAFGVIADVQWADTEDGYNFGRTVKRCFRGSFQTLGAAVDYWRDYQQQIQETITQTQINSSNNENNNNDVIDSGSCSIHKIKNNAEDGQDKQPQPQPIPLSFIAQLGDIIDGVNMKLGQSDIALQKALQELERAPCPSINLIGNHELYNFNRKYLSSKVASSWLRHGDKEYYSFQPTNTVGWRIIVLDPYQISLLGFQSDSKNNNQDTADDEEEVDVRLFSTYREAVKVMANEHENPTISISPIDDGLASSEKKREG